MTALEQVNRYLRSVEWRLRAFAMSRGLALTTFCALALTLLFVDIGNRFEFAGRVVLPLRLTLYAALATCVALLLVRPLLKMNRRWLARRVEAEAPEFGERLLTLTERGKQRSAWMELLAEETLAIAREHSEEHLRPRRLVAGLATGALVGAGILVWLIAAGPGYWGYGAALLWTGHADVNKRPLYSVEVQPGNKTVRRRSDLTVTAQLMNFSAPDVILHARYGKATKWEAARMEPGKGADRYRFTFAAVSEPVEYFVEAAHTESKHFTISVRDLPGVKRVRVALHFPSELQLQDAVFDPGGDIRAVTGTQAKVSVQTDRPLDRGVIVLDNGKQIPLQHGTDDWASAIVLVQKDGAYHVAAIDGGETIRISEDYFIEAKKDEPPTVKIAKPGNDLHVSPIEEMPVAVNASDDYGLGGVELHYAVNGGKEQSIPLLKAKGTKDAEGKTTIAFEDLKAAPGDLVSMYAVARDAHSTSRSEIVFAQADAFDYRFSQSQQTSGMNGGGSANVASDMTRRQREIISATFNQLKAGKTGAARTEDAKFLSGEQAKLRDQAITMAQRMANRELGSAGSEFEQFAKLLTQAATDMDIATDQLKPAKWDEALPPEQKALTSLLRAEALFRDIQISMSRQGNSGQNSAGRDLARMLDLELDTTKNQYETGQSASTESPDRQKALDEAQRRLEELARRQQELASQSLKQQQGFEQRWQEEQLRREAEQLRRHMEQLAQNSQNGQQQAQNGQQQSGQQQDQQSQQGQQPGQQQAQQQGQQGEGQQGQQGQQWAQSGGSQMSPSQYGSQQYGSQQSGQQRIGGNQAPGSWQPRGALRNGNQAASRAGAAQMNETLRQAMRALERAEDEMRKSVSNRDQTAGARAAEQLKQAQQLMAQALQKQAGGTVSDLASRAEQIAGAQRDLANRIKQMYGANTDDARQRELIRRFGGNPYGRYPRGQTPQDPNSMPEMNDPTARRRFFGYRMGGGNFYSAPPSRQPTASEKSVADEQEKLAAQIESLQRQLQQQAQEISGARPDASAKLMRALSEAEGKELALRLQKNAEWMRQGYGDRNLGMEDNVTVGLQNLSKALREIKLSLDAPDPAAEARQNGRPQVAGTRTPAREDSPEAYRDAVAGYFKKLSQTQGQKSGR